MFENMKGMQLFFYTVDGKKAFIFFDNDTPLPVAKEMIFQCQKQLGQIEDNAKAQEEAQTAALSKADEPVQDHCINQE